MKGSQPPSWNSLCTALRDPLVNCKDIASSIEQKYHIMVGQLYLGFDINFGMDVDLGNLPNQHPL